MTGRFIGRPRAARVEWTRLVGIALVCMAILLATHPDYPIPRVEGGLTARVPVTPEPAPRPIEPRGTRAPDTLDSLVFRWDSPGPPRTWSVEILDANLLSLWTSPPTTEVELPAPEDLVELLAAGGPFLWLVKTVDDAPPLRCSPVLLDVAVAAAPAGRR